MGNFSLNVDLPSLTCMYKIFKYSSTHDWLPFRLVQYQGTNMDFEDSESSGTWCGTTNITCPSCSNQLQGNDITQRYILDCCYGL